MTAGTPAPPSSGKSNIFGNLIGQLVETTKLVDDLREPLRHVDEGGAATYVRLATDDPMDHDAHAQPVLAIAVADVERILATFVPFRVMVIDEPKGFVAGDTGRGKYEPGTDIADMIARLIRMGRKSDLSRDLNRPRLIDPDQI